MQDCDLGHVSLNETTFQYNNGHHRVGQIRARLVTTCWPHSQDRGAGWPAGRPADPVRVGRQLRTEIPPTLAPRRYGDRTVAAFCCGALGSEWHEADLPRHLAVCPLSWVKRT